MELTGFLGRLARADFADALGIYVTAGMVSLVLVRKRVNSVKVVAVESAELAGESDARDSVLEGVIKAFVERHGIDDARVSLAVGRDITMFGDLQLPASAVANLEQVLGYEMDRLLPIPAEELYSDTLVRPVGEGDEKFAVTVVTVMKKEADRLREILEGLGLEGASFTAQPVAACDFFEFCSPTAAGVTGLVTGEGEQTCMAVCYAGSLVSSRTWDRYVVEPAEGRLRREVERFLPERLDAELRIVGSSGSDGEVSLAELLPADCLAEGVYISDNEAIAVGAALGQLGEGRQSFCLLPADMVRGSAGFGLREMALAAVVLLMAGGLAMTIGLKNLAVNGALAAEVGRLAPLAAQVSSLEEENRQRLDLVFQLEADAEQSVLSYLRAVTTLVPRTAYLTTFRFKGDRIELDGIADSASGLIGVLEKSPLFNNVEFTAPTTKYLQSQERFSLRMRIEK
ncbi:MAG TPA: hypothetical protein EYG16_02150 [Deltaproteobacteria bacterium]|nr:hypothetical protein [Candidatus Binatota bacterium]HIL12455.1 hypothetical protein [Deltaproteobacteria bacterium]